MLKKILVLGFLVLFLNCTQNNIPANCLLPFSVEYSSDTNLPLFNSLVIGNAIELPGGAKGIILFQKKTDEYVAFDRICPENNCNNPMIYENRLLKCSCDNSAYSLDFGGAPQTDGFLCPAIAYKVTKNGSRIRISNF